MPDKFDPKQHITKIERKSNGKTVGTFDYLTVKWRLVWLRKEHPGAVIKTEPYGIDSNGAIFRAEVTLPDGGSATGWGSRGGGGDYVEKAETRALGRALAALGFGTEGADEFEDDDPVEDDGDQAPPVFARTLPTAHEASGKPEPKPEQKPAQPGHIKAMFAAANEFKWPDEAVKALGKRAFGVASTNDLTADQVASLRTRMKRCREIADRMNTLWSADGIAEHLAECGVGSVLEMTGEQLTGTEALLKRESADLGLVSELYAATR